VFLGQSSGGSQEKKGYIRDANISRLTKPKERIKHSPKGKDVTASESGTIVYSAKGTLLAKGKYRYREGTGHIPSI